MTLTRTRHNPDPAPACWLLPPRQGFLRFAKLELTKAVIQNKIPEFDPTSRSPWTELNYGKAYLQEELKKRPPRPRLVRFLSEEELLEMIGIARKVSKKIRHHKVTAAGRLLVCKTLTPLDWPLQEMAKALETVGEADGDGPTGAPNTEEDEEAQKWKRLMEAQNDDAIQEIAAPLFEAFVARFPTH